MHDALSAFGFRLYYYYALRPPQGASGPPAQGGTEAPPADPEVSVRRAGRGDLEAVVRLGMESVHYHASLEPTMRVPRDEGKKMRRRFETVLAEPGESTIFVAELQRQIAGFYSIYLQSIDDSWTPPLFAPGRYGLIAEVAVDPRFRKRGIGHRLFDAASQWFHERGARSFWLIYLPANPLSSRFWTSLGFAPVWEVLLQDEGGPLC